MNAHQKGWIAGAVWGVAEVLRTHGEEVIARDMLGSLGNFAELRKHAEPCDIEEIEKHPWVHKSNAASEQQPEKKA